MVKRILSVLLVLTMLLSLSAGLGVVAFADGPITVTMDDITVASPVPNTVNVPISINTNGNALGIIILDIKFDTDVLQFLDFTKSSDYDHEFYNVSPTPFNIEGGKQLQLSFSTMDNGIIDSGEVGFVTFRINNKTAYGTYPLTLSLGTSEQNPNQVSVGYIVDGTEVAGSANLNNGSIKIPCPGHEFPEQPTWSWADDHSSATAKLTCTVCNEDVYTATDSAPTHVNTAKCEAAGKEYYEAKVTLNGTDYTDKTAETDSSPLGHLWAVDTTSGTNGWTWTDATPPTATVALKCTRQDCNATVAAAPATVSEQEGSHAADCTTEGSVTYVATTGETYKDAEGNSFTDTKGPVTTPATGHNYSIVQSAGNKSRVVSGAQNNGWTWTKNGSNYTASLRVQCANENNAQSDLTAEVTSESTAVCKTAGTTTYTAKVEYKVGDTVVFTETDTLTETGDIVNHAWEATPDWDTYDATAGTVSVTLHCTNKNCPNEQDTVITANVTATPVQAATCTAEGTSNLSVSGTEDGGSYSASQNGVTVPKLGHAWQLDTSAADTNGTGWKFEGGRDATAYFTCSRTDCNETQSVKAEVKTETPVQAANCTTAGSSTIVFKAAPENKTGSDTGLDPVDSDSQTVTIPANGHNWGAVTFTWSADNTTAKAKRVCGTCNEAQEVDAAMSDAVTTNETCTAEGVRTYTAKGVFPASFSGATDAVVEADAASETKDVAIPASTHQWGQVSFNWDGFKVEDGSGKVVASCTCSNPKHDAAKDGEATQTMDATVTVNEGGTAATCVAAANRTFTASAQFTGMTQAETDTKADDTAALGHDYADPADTDWTWADDFSSASVTLTCQREGCTAETTDHTKTLTDNAPTSSVTTEPACETAGVRTYTATVKVNESDTKSYTGTKTAEIPANGHTWGDPADADWTFDDEAKSATVTFTCTVCGNTQTVDATKTDETETVPVSCLTDGNLRLTFSAVIDEGKDNKKKVEGKTHDILEEATGHDLEKHDKVDATCDAEGTREYYTCNNCDMIFADESATSAADDLSATFDTWKVLEAYKHNTLEVYAHVDSTMEADGNYAYAYCPLCEKFFLIEDSANPTEASEDIVYYANGDAIKGHTGLKGIDAKGEARETNYDQYIKIAKQDVLYGDVNGDGEVDALDLLRLQRYFARLTTDIHPKNTDCNGDGNIDALDLLRLQRYFARLANLGPDA